VTTLYPSGEQFEISHGEQRATIVEVGGGVREYSHGGREVLHPYPLQAICDGAHGAPLVPWPNRLADGRYSFDGVAHQVALTEPRRHNAIHGLLRWRPWRAVEREPNAVVMGARLHPLAGYPFALDVRIAYRLDDTGLTVETTALNVGSAACPYACGQHPYLSPGSGTIDECTLELRARTRIVTDPVRKLPCGAEPVAASAFDFRSPRALGSQQIDNAFTDLERDADGRARARLAAPDGGCVELWVEQGYTVIEIYTADELAPTRRRCGLAAEPMTCPPNGLQTGEGLIRLQPGEHLTTRWGVRLT